MSNAKKSWWTENHEEMQSLALDQDAPICELLEHVQDAAGCETFEDFKANLESALQSLDDIKAALRELASQLPRRTPLRVKCERCGRHVDNASGERCSACLEEFGP